MEWCPAQKVLEPGLCSMQVKQEQGLWTVLLAVFVGGTKVDSGDSIHPLLRHILF